MYNKHFCYASNSKLSESSLVFDAITAKISFFLFKLLSNKDKLKI